ncbi:unnamed protein product [Zymoseptoria tritici ST99CH_3D1]|nr:unnamed protein product [Zymoseptoria tritici ST99CH_3D1]
MVSSGHELVSYGGPSSAGSANLPSETTTQPGSDNITPSGDAMLHPSGDLLIYHNEFTIPLLLCSKAFALLCKPWAKMVEYRMVMGSEESKEDERMKIDLSDDDPIALSILLYISHLRFEMVPSFLSLKQLFALSVLTDKYEATRMVRPWIAHWLSIWNFASMETKVANVWIAWEFGLLGDFERIATALVLDAEIKDDSDSLFYNSKELPGEVPPGLIESALEVRRKVIGQLLDIAYAYLDRCRLPPPPVYTSTFTTAPFRSGFCQTSAGTHACHVSMCGSLLLGLQEIGLYTRRDTAPCNLSINKLATALQGLKIFHFSLASPGVHAGCDPIPELKRKVKEVLANIPSAVTTAHAAHIQRQKKLLGGDKTCPPLLVPFQVASRLFSHTR